MRDKIITEIYKLEKITGIECMEDLRTWSNYDLLQYYGSLRVEEYYQWQEHEQTNTAT